MQKSYVLRLLVDNQVGVLDRISILVRRSGWNVRGIHSCNEPQRGGTRVDLAVEGRADLRLLLAQLERLDCVRELSHAPRGEEGGRELALARSGEREALARVAQRHGARLLRSEGEEDIYELCADEGAAGRFLEDCVRECSARTMRSGAIHI